MHTTAFSNNISVTTKVKLSQEKTLLLVVTIVTVSNQMHRLCNVHICGIISIINMSCMHI